MAMKHLSPLSDKLYGKKGRNEKNASCVLSFLALWEGGESVVIIFHCVLLFKEPSRPGLQPTLTLTSFAVAARVVLLLLLV